MPAIFPFESSAREGSLLLVGLGGYGRTYARAALPFLDSGAMRVAAVVDPFAERAEDWPALAERGVPRFDTVEEAVAAGARADLATVATPIALHAGPVCAALEAGMPTLCEKPIAGSADDIRRMTEARDRAKRFVAIGYQWSFTPAVQALKAAVSAGRLGAPRRLRACVVWPRDAAYYARNRWAGRIRDDAGRLVLDSPVNNAAAHYLHNMLFVIGGEADRSAKPLSVEAELYRANPIENFDAACMRIATDIGAEVDFVAVHCADVSFGPASVFEFEEATVTFEGAGSTFHAVFRDGREEDFGSPDAGGHTGKLWSCLAAARAGRFEDRPPCGIETATPHATVVSGLAEIPVADLPRPLLRSAPLAPGAAPTTWCEGMADAAREAYRHGALFSERGTPWAATPRVVRFAG